MKYLLQLFLIGFISQNVSGQELIPLFSEVDEVTYEALDLGLIDTYTLLDLNDEVWEDILANHSELIEIEIPYGTETLKMVLHEVELFHSDLNIRTASGTSFNYAENSRSVFYQGFFQGHPNSHFALSVLNYEVIGIGSIPGIGDVNLGELPGKESYIFYAEPALDGTNDFTCETRGDLPDPDLVDVNSRALVEDCTSLYFEVDYDIFLAKGGLMEATDYMMALFNEVQFLFELAEMTVYIGDLMVWDEESPYYLEADTGILLDLFGTTTTDWEGDLGHLVTNSASGGLAWLNVYCHPNQAMKKAVSGIALTFEEVPIYSWSVEVIAHEMGHNMGSPHTHACFWNGDMTAIDGCGPSAGFDEGCEGDVPPLGGSVMSYCHLTPAGIDLVFGFGFQPGGLMRNIIIESECLSSCDLQEMDVQVTGGTMSAACENAPVSRELTIINNGNENLTYFTANIYLDGELWESVLWSGLIPEGEEGTILFSDFSLPLGTYSMIIEIELPDGYDDLDMSDNSFTFNFEVHPFPEPAFTPEPDQLVSYDATTRMMNESSGAASYIWDMGDGSPDVTGISPEHTFPFEKGGVYEVTLSATSEFGCTATTSELVTVEGVNIFYIPNTFTADNDNFNDTFKPVFTAGLDIYDYHLTIFNRWGEIVFESYNVATGWDGTYGNRGVADGGVYIWEIEFGDLTSDEKHQYTGHVNLLK